MQNMVNWKIILVVKIINNHVLLYKELKLKDVYQEKKYVQIIKLNHNVIKQLQIKLILMIVYGIQKDVGIRMK